MKPPACGDYLPEVRKETRYDLYDETGLLCVAGPSPDMCNMILEGGDGGGGGRTDTLPLNRQEGIRLLCLQ